ncbi:hypothetical protein JCM11251_000883 [Rhodosporidiobolus azoricus]
MHSTYSPNPPSLSGSANSHHSAFFALHHPYSHSHSHSHSHPSRRNSASSSSDEDNASSFSHHHMTRTSPDLSRLTPSSSVPSSPKRAPGLSPSSSYSLRPSSLSAPASPSLGETGEFSLPSPLTSSSSPASPTHSNDAAEEDEDEAPITALPGRLPRPKTKLDRERERATGLGLNGGAGGVKKEGLGKKLARKRADSLKWAKYANVGTFEIELGLSNDELMRK